MFWKLAVSLFAGTLGLAAFVLLLCACILSSRKSAAIRRDAAHAGLPEASTGEEAPKRFDAEVSHEAIEQAHKEDIALQSGEDPESR